MSQKLIERAVLLSGLMAALPVAAQPASGSPAAAERAAVAEPAAEAERSLPEETVAEAARRFELGLGFYRDGDFRLAVIEFDRAYELVPDYRVLFNIGQVNIQLGNYARARRALERYLAEGGDEVPPERIEQVNADLEMLRPRTAYLVITVSVDGAEILIDDEPIGFSPLAEPLLVDAGRHSVTARHRGSSAIPQSVVVAGGDERTVSLQIKTEEPAVGPQPGDVSPPVGTPPPGAFPPPVEPPFPRWWLGWTATGALAAGATVVGVVAVNAAQENERLQSVDTTRDELEDSAGRAGTLLGVTDALTAATVITAGLSVYVTARHFRGVKAARSGGENERGAASVGASTSSGAGSRGRWATVLVGPSGLAICGEF